MFVPVIILPNTRSYINPQIPHRPKSVKKLNLIERDIGQKIGDAGMMRRFLSERDIGKGGGKRRAVEIPE